MRDERWGETPTISRCGCATLEVIGACGRHPMEGATMVRRVVVGLVSGILFCESLVCAGMTHADDNGWGPPKHWCPGEPALMTGNDVTDPLNWDWNVCHTYDILYPGMGNVSQMFWDGDNPREAPRRPVFTAICRHSPIAGLATTPKGDYRRSTNSKYAVPRIASP